MTAGDEFNNYETKVRDEVTFRSVFVNFLLAVLGHHTSPNFVFFLNIKRKNLGLGALYVVANRKESALVCINYVHDDASMARCDEGW